MKYYKVLNEDGTACHGGSGKWSLPKGKRPGAWMPKIKGKLIACENGYHLCRKKDLIHWLGPAIYEAEGRGEKIISDRKIVFRQARILRKLDTWNERTQRLFAADCAEHVLHIYEKQCPNDDRPRKAIQVARDFANGLIESAARSAAESAAWSAARSAAESAAGLAARSAAGSAAESAAWLAAWSAAWSAAQSAAWSAEREWQTRRLFKYLEGKCES